MNTKIGKSLGLTFIMLFGVMATMLALGLFGPGKASAAAPAPKSMTASPGSPGDGSSIKIGFELDTTIAGNTGELWVAFDAKYGIPATIAKTSISIASGQTTGGVSNPLIDPTVAEQIAADSTGTLASGDTIVKLQLGDTTPADTTVTGLYSNIGGTDHTVTFATSAGITLPTAASTKEIWLSQNQGGLWSTATATVDVNAITVVRELTLSSTSGARGKAVTATGKGFTTTGNTTLWVDTDDSGTIGTDEYVIASDVAVTSGKFEYEFTTDTNFPLSAVAINAQGGDGLSVGTTTNPAFTSYGKITLDKTEVARGGSLKVTAVDIQAGTVSAITIGAVASTLPSDVTINTTGVDKSFTVTVGATTPLGKQKIILDTTAEADRYSTVTITGAPVTVSPATAVAGQEVTLSGTGFTKNDGLATITVGSRPVTNTSSGGIEDTSATIANVDTDSSGNFNTSFLIPDHATTRTAGSHKILVTDDTGLTGEVYVTVPGRTLSVDTDESKRGSEVTVTGTGYEAKGTVTLTYTSGSTDTSLGSATVDSYGEFSKVITVPNSADIPSTNTITGEITNGGSKTVTHKIGQASITMDVVEQSTGESIVITGEGFPAYSTVATMTIGTLDVRPTPAPSTNVDGGFTATVMVPGLTEGNHTVKVTASSITGSTSIKVIPTTAAVVAVSTATEDVFADTIAAENLVRVWKFSNADQSWSFYDPREAFAAANTLANTASGDIVWVNVTAEEAFQSTTLYPGWNLISLD